MFPHLNVYENIAFGLRIPKADASGNKIKLSEEEIDRRVLEMLERCRTPWYSWPGGSTPWTCILPHF